VSLRIGTVGVPHGCTKSGSNAAIEYLRANGFDAYEIAWVQSVRVKDESCAQMKECGQRNDVKLSVHAPYYINLNSQTDELMQKSDARLLLAARKGYLAGATEIIFHPGSYHSQPAERCYERAKEKLIELTSILREEGVQVNLRPETMGKGAMFGNLEEVVQLSKEIPGVAPCIDVAHLHARTGDGTFNTYNEFAAMFKLVRDQLGLEGLHQLHFHISGIEYSSKGERNHVMLEESDLRWREFLQVCIDNDVQGTVVVESPRQDEDARLLQSTYRELGG
jgi:deoxyribonuclease IV